VPAHLLHLIRDRKLAYASVNQASCALRFLYRRVLGRPEAGFDIPMAKVPVPAPDAVITATVEDFLQRVGRAQWARCPHCHDGRFVPTAAIPVLREAMPQLASVRGPP